MVPVPTPQRAEPRPQYGWVALGLVGVGWLLVQLPPAQGLLLGLGVGLGFTLFHARFGFSSAFRQLLSVGQGRALQAHMLLLAVTATLFAFLFALGKGLGGQPLAGYQAPIGLGLLLGAFLFGVGMQLAGGCASGTLYATGSGSLVGAVALAAFMAGSVLGAWNLEFWTAGPGSLGSLPPISLAERLGLWGALALTLVWVGALALLAEWVIRKRQPPPLREPEGARGWARILRGSWPLWVAALVLAVLNAAVLYVSGRPWGVTAGLTLWGSQAVEALGLAEPVFWAYWNGRSPLELGFLGHPTSLTNLGILLGALLSAAAAGVFGRNPRLGWKTLLAAVLGGLLMGYGARLAYGCNIGAYIGGVASFSLHGWVWLGMALLGTGVGLWLRPWFGLSNPKPTDSVC
ncbi:MAG: YeeE/YedE family protein [Meiothermus sp.]|uniref:YeeE/YedE family protein n=1 Tax=Meiothermus sp. TaxID=1955249 RepID=UPI0025CE234E|nr:YeeE/YedE family protein [Meiothermus sp.]MCS7058099.1 YeeE/YedE family protein [Meiothermus sp.]MCS7193745.1 YeeE/YedE family protein [Meiothermus sp.]MCX7741497.1 YeeE/YedE family protein [Meiothermus sp.]MDW8090105.1 YeeE/YedE family protein [Meiothermus sp.]MDW8481409.1 YeeE/YedE family protein [Meiothermus sp.]